MVNDAALIRKLESDIHGAKPFYYALVLHLVILLMFAFSFRWPWESKTNTQVIQAVVVDHKAKVPRKDPEPKKAKPVEKPATKKQEKPKQTKAIPKTDTARQKRLDAEKQKKEAQRRQKEDKQRLQEMLAQEEAERAEAERQQRANALVAEYREVIRQKVSRNWVRPAKAAKGLECSVRVRLAPGGEVLNAVVTKSSGDMVFDRSVENAVYKAAPLPIPEDQEAFDYFREIEFLFNPED